MARQVDDHGRRLIDWSLPLQSGHRPPRPASVLFDEPLLTKRKRVWVPNRDRAGRERWEDVPGTTWLYDEFGNCGTAEKSPSPLDLHYAETGQ